MTHKLPKSISCATSAQNFLQERRRRKNKGLNQSILITRIQNMQLQASLKEVLIPNLHTSTKIDVPSVETPLTCRDFNAQLRNFNAMLAIILANSQAFVFRRISKTKHLTSLGIQRPIS